MKFIIKNKLIIKNYIGGMLVMIGILWAVRFDSALLMAVLVLPGWILLLGFNKPTLRDIKIHCDPDYKNM